MTNIKSILLNSEPMKNYIFKGEDCTNTISNLSKINILIGSNNSGKSKFMRNIFSDNKLKFNSNTVDLDTYNELVKNLNNEIGACFETTPITKIGKIDNTHKLKELEHLEEGKDYLADTVARILNLIATRGNEQITFNGGRSLPSEQVKNKLSEDLNRIGLKYKNEFDEKGIESFIENKPFDKIYIPILRGLRPLNEKEDLFQRRTLNDYFKGEDVNIFTGQNLYNDVLKLLCGNLKDRRHLKEFEEFLGNNFFDFKELSLTPKIGEDVLYVKIGEEKEQPIYNLGDGIQSIIILTFQLFARKGEDVLFFIEEPELYLHPGLQRKLVETLLSDEFNTYQYFITTHSNHLLDLTLDMRYMSVYKFYKEIGCSYDSENLEKDAQFIIENVNDGDTSVLKLLGVNNSSIFLSNCTIWVEGITDRFYIRKYLEIYQREKLREKEINKVFQEDIHYSFIEYSGGNITHWDFLDEDSEDDLKPMNHKSICNKIFLISDNDGYTSDENKHKKKGERIAKLTKYFEENFYCLDAKEVENILTPKVIKNTVAKFKHKTKITDIDSELLNEVEFSLEEYKNINLGEFIDKKIDSKIEEKKKADTDFTYERRKDFKKGNTISSKGQFCEYAISNINSLDDMSNDAIELCEKIYLFIQDSN